MQNLSTHDSTYETGGDKDGWARTLFPALRFYPRFLALVYRCAALARRGQYDVETWQQTSIEVLRFLESVGVQFEVRGLEHVHQVKGPVIFIGNHLSIMETVVLPSWILPYKTFTYVIKQSLLEVPIFKQVMKTVSPIAVTRTNPRHDLKIVLEQGCERLSRNLSIIIFPQTTRAPFNPEQFSTIGIKLARKAGVPVIPLALLTDAWENGKISKDFGRIVPSRKAYFAFGEAMEVEGKGSREHQLIIEFIQANLAEWERERS